MGELGSSPFYLVSDLSLISSMVPLPAPGSLKLLGILQATSALPEDLLSSQAQPGCNGCSSWQAMYCQQLSQLSANFPECPHA